jgi:hypothetical protein
VINTNGGFNKWKMEVVEEIETENKKEVYIREQYWIKQTENKLNKRNAIFDMNEYMRCWYKSHKQDILEKKKEYYINNREKRLEYQSKYYQKKKSNHNINDSENNEVPCEIETI